ncbi:hypothetical protein NG798_25960 [Ancylothrix sp. C2]|uniref:hypothetical protein n=1 Tax=Ancylothrix sp. D3o TaxID=2953691 RepID=UPI0021BAF604|nr:hypothetical protein [Ancylothrix sp. D3o]MCT7953248.1 hypothetical protein [Ancylothrix sp. D3o]
MTYTASPSYSKKTSTAPSVSAQTSPLSPAFAAYLIVTLSTSIPTPRAITLSESVTAPKPGVERSVSSVKKETNRDDLLAIERIRIRGTYEAGWAGPESIGPTRSAVEHAEDFARYIFSLGKIEIPYISASGDGELNFFWKKDGFILDLGFKGDGFYSYYAQLPNGQEMIEDAAIIGTPLPEDIVKVITQKT